MSQVFWRVGDPPRLSRLWNPPARLAGIDADRRLGRIWARGTFTDIATMVLLGMIRSNVVAKRVRLSGSEVRISE